MSPSIDLATNNADIGGGEVMLLALAQAMGELGVRARIVVPSASPIAQRALEGGHEVLGLAGEGRRGWMRSLRRWHASRPPGHDRLLWCNGLVPALATAGQRDRVVHLHRAPDGWQRAAVGLARRGARATLVPSHSLAATVGGARVLANWCPGPEHPPARPEGDGPLRVGLMGRLTPEKGVADLVAAVRRLPPGTLEVIVAGESRFTGDDVAATIESALASLGAACTRLGWVTPELFHARVDVVAVPSVVPEAFGLVAAEAMAAVLPVVVSDAGALPEVVGPGHPWVARAGDPHDLARVLREVVAAGPAGRAEVAAAGRLRWEQHHSPAAGRARLGLILAELGLLPSSDGRTR